MLTHEELMEKCKELQDAAYLLLDAMRENDYIFNPDLKDHEYHMDNMIAKGDSLGSIYLENRDNISDADAKEIISAIVTSSSIATLVYCTDKNTPTSLLVNNVLTSLNNAN